MKKHQVVNLISSSSTATYTNISVERGLIYSLLNWYFRICSFYHIFHSEVLKLKEVFVNNGYPVALFDRCLSIFLDKIFSPPISNITVSKRVVHFCLPFTGVHSLQIQTKLIKLVSSCFPQIDLRVVLKPGKRLSTFFQFKDPIPKFLKSHVVYQFLIVNAVERCILGKHAVTYTRVFQNTWEFRLWLARKFHILHVLAFLHIQPKLATPFSFILLYSFFLQFTPWMTYQRKAPHP